MPSPDSVHRYLQSIGVTAPDPSKIANRQGQLSGPNVPRSPQSNHPPQPVPNGQPGWQGYRPQNAPPPPGYYQQRPPQQRSPIQPGPHHPPIYPNQAPRGPWGPQSPQYQRSPQHGRQPNYQPRPMYPNRSGQPVRYAPDVRWQQPHQRGKVSQGIVNWFGWEKPSHNLRPQTEQEIQDVKHADRQRRKEIRDKFGRITGAPVRVALHFAGDRFGDIGKGLTAAKNSVGGVFVAGGEKIRGGLDIVLAKFSGSQRAAKDAALLGQLKLKLRTTEHVQGALGRDYWVDNYGNWFVDRPRQGINGWVTHDGKNYFNPLTREVKGFVKIYGEAIHVPKAVRKHWEELREKQTGAKKWRSSDPDATVPGSPGRSTVQMPVVAVRSGDGALSEAAVAEPVTLQRPQVERGAETNPITMFTDQDFVEIERGLQAGKVEIPDPRGTGEKISIPLPIASALCDIYEEKDMAKQSALTTLKTYTRDYIEDNLEKVISEEQVNDLIREMASYVTDYYKGQNFDEVIEEWMEKNSISGQQAETVRRTVVAYKIMRGYIMNAKDSFQGLPEVDV